MAIALENIPQTFHKDLIVGYEHSDDAAVFRLDEKKALIQTLDFFTPVVDDPYVFGKIAAANSLSDIYAMGGYPIVAMNIVCFPNCLDMRVLGEILRGGREKVDEAGAILVGGHSVEDNEPKYGLSVSGLVSPDKVLTNAGLKPGDALILTKPLGTGILNTAFKGDIIEERHYKKAVEVMEHLNKYAAMTFKHFDVHAVTDITGFGLIGHLIEMAKASDTTIRIKLSDVPVIDGVLDYAEMGIIPGGMYRNKEYFEKDVRLLSSSVQEALMDVLYDPQTSGGLLISLPAAQSIQMTEALKKSGSLGYQIIGTVSEKEEKYIVLE